MNLRLTIFKRFVNATSQILHGQFFRLTFIVTVIVFLGGGCTPPLEEPRLRLPWQVVRVVDALAPVGRPALWADGDQRFLLWTGEPTMPNLRLLPSSADTPISLPLGIRPREVSIYPLPFGWYQLLWLDQSLPDKASLVGGTLNAALEVRRGPTDIARENVLEYVGLVTPEGMIQVFWTELNKGKPRLYGMLIDSVGRPRSPILITDSGRFPAAAFDQRGDLHLVWADPGASRIWTVRSLVIPGGTLESVPTLLPDQIALIPLNTQQTLEALVINLDRIRTYAIWGVAQVDEGVSGRLGGVILSPNSLPTSIPFPSEADLRLPASVSGGRLAEGAIFTVLGRQNSPTPDTIALITLRPNGGMELALITPTPLPGVIGGVSAVLLDSGKMRMAWSLLRSDGRTQIYETAERE